MKEGENMKKIADCVVDPSQTDQPTRDFRNRYFDLHMCVPAGIEHPRYEYAKPTDHARTAWMLSTYGEAPTTAVPGTPYVDLSVPANRSAIARAINKRVVGIAADGVMIDCLMECAPGQQWYAVDLFREIKAELGTLTAIVNFGDVYTWGTSDVNIPWGAIAKEADQFCQVAINVGDTRFSLSQFSRAVATATSRLNDGKLVIIGILDPGGLNAAKAVQMMDGPISEKPNCYWYYSESGDPKEPVAKQYPEGYEGTVDPPPPPGGTVPLGLNADLSARGNIYSPPDNWWNRDITSAPVDPNSSSIVSFVASLGNNGYLHPDFNKDYGIPYVSVAKNAPLFPVTLGNTSESDKGAPGMPAGYPIPIEAQTNNAYRENAGNTDGDRHLLMICHETGLVYELSYAEYSGGKWSAGYGAVFKVNENYRRPEGWTSTSAGGMSVLAGLIRPDEVFGTQPIRHALRCSFNKINGYVWPASHKGSSDSGAPPLGTRIRLKASKDISGYPAPVRKVLQALKTYGGLVDDRGGGYVAFQGVQSSKFDPAVWNPAFHGIKITEFEVIKLGWGKP